MATTWLDSNDAPGLLSKYPHLNYMRDTFLPKTKCACDVAQSRHVQLRHIFTNIRINTKNIAMLNSLFLFLFLHLSGVIEVLPATSSPSHLIVFSTLICILSSSASLPPLQPSSHYVLTQSSHLSLGLARLLLPCSRNTAALIGSVS